MATIKIKHKTCTASLEIKQNMIVIDQIKCIREPEHEGMHVSPAGHRWMTQDHIQRIIENEGLK